MQNKTRLCSRRRASVDNQNEKNRCVNCGIKSVPLYLGLDGKLHCADHIGLLLPSNKPERPAEEEHHG